MNKFVDCNSKNEVIDQDDEDELYLSYNYLKQIENSTSKSSNNNRYSNQIKDSSISSSQSRKILIDTSNLTNTNTNSITNKILNDKLKANASFENKLNHSNYRCNINYNSNTTSTSISMTINELHKDSSYLSSQPLLSTYYNQQIISQEENTQIKRMKYQESINQSTYPENTNTKSNNQNLNLSAYRSDAHNSSNDEETNLLTNLSFNSNSNSNSSPTTNIKNNSNNNNNNNKLVDNSFYGLPKICKDLLKELRNIGCLYDWQDELLTMVNQKYEASLTKEPFVLKNLLYLSPTSGGKTLIAELIMLHCLLVRKKNCIFVMPFVSIVQEKVLAMQPFSDRLNFHVEEYAGVKGMIPPIKRHKNKPSLYVCTIEKAHSLINSLIETERLTDEIGLVFADEVHMISDGSRGAIYEMILSKVKFCSKMIHSNSESQKLTKNCIQIVATTATLQNKDEIAKFLNADSYEKNFRPVELKEYVKMEKSIYEIDRKNINKMDINEDSFLKYDRTVELDNYTAEMKKDDPDGLIKLVKEVIPEQSCLIFCPTKKNCENVAQLLSKYLIDEFKTYKRDLKLKLFQDLKEENGNNVCPVLRQSIQCGIAYHHSGLTTEERQLIEQAYRDGVLSIITCTSTLAAGVNLPAKRVIIRSPYVGQAFVSTNSYKQMIGRAGRAGLIDSTGESILLFQNKDKKNVYALLTEPMKRCESSFECDDKKAIRLLVLSLIGLNMAHYGSQILLFFKETLFYLQNNELLKDKRKNENVIISSDTIKDTNELFVPDEFYLLSNALAYLFKNQLITIKNDKIPENLDDESCLKCLYFAHFEIKKLGMAAIKGNINLDYVDQLYRDLDLGLKSIVLSNCLHLLYLCTPYDLINSVTNMNYDTYARKYCNLRSDEQKCASIIGVQENYIQSKRYSTKINSKNVDENAVKRFYMTLIIYELWKTNNSIWSVSNEFQLDRGFVQQIIQSSASFTSGVLHFCEYLDEFWPYKNLLQDFTKRLQFNCSPIELTPLLELENVKQARAKQLFNAGYKTLELIATAKDVDISAKIKNLPISAANKIIKSAKRLLKEKLDLLQAEADNLLLQINT